MTSMLANLGKSVDRGGLQGDMSRITARILLVLNGSSVSAATQKVCGAHLECKSLLQSASNRLSSDCSHLYAQPGVSET